MNRYAKAIFAALGAAYAVYQITTGDNSPAGGGITQQEWMSIIMSGLFVGGGVWAVPNTPPLPAPTPAPDMTTTVNVGDAVPGTPFARPGLHTMEDHT